MYSWNPTAIQFGHKHPKPRMDAALAFATQSWETREGLVGKETDTEYSLTKPTSGLCWILFLFNVCTLDLAGMTKIQNSVH